MAPKTNDAPTATAAGTEDHAAATIAQRVEAHDINKRAAGLWAHMKLRLGAEAQAALRDLTGGDLRRRTGVISDAIVRVAFAASKRQKLLKFLGKPAKKARKPLTKTAVKIVARRKASASKTVIK